MTPTWTLSYASSAFRRITVVTFRSEAMARHWWKKCLLWSDVLRARVTGPDREVLADQAIEHRITTDDHRLSAGCVGGVITNERLVVAWPPSSTDAPTARPSLLTTNDLCWCGHTQVQHAGAAGDGTCMGAGGSDRCRCTRFGRRSR